MLSASLEASVAIKPAQFYVSWLAVCSSLSSYSNQSSAGIQKTGDLVMSGNDMKCSSAVTLCNLCQLAGARDAHNESMHKSLGNGTVPTNRVWRGLKSCDTSAQFRKIAWLPLPLAMTSSSPGIADTSNFR